ncbi:MAG: SDR family oxidoreductase [Opitutales bacterium]
MSQRTFVITGASKGIGRASAELFAGEGHTVIGLARSDCPDFPGEYHPCDLGDEAATDAALETIFAQHQVDGILNNVGLVRGAPVAEIELADLRAVLDMNLRPAIRLFQRALPHMQAQRWGRVVNISSITSLGSPWRSSYSAAKAALVGLTRTWALEFATDGITANAIHPGPIDTELFRTNNPAGSESEQRYLSGIPMKRIGTPEEVAAAVAFFFSEPAGFITGQSLYIDGGFSTGSAPA